MSVTAFKPLAADAARCFPSGHPRSLLDGARQSEKPLIDLRRHLAGIGHRLAVAVENAGFPLNAQDLLLEAAGVRLSVLQLARSSAIAWRSSGLRECLVLREEPPFQAYAGAHARRLPAIKLPPTQRGGSPP